jgi:hypothetical protein
MKCSVKDCKNQSHQGDFVGLLCGPCHDFIAGGDSIYSQAYRNMRSMIDAAVSKESGARMRAQVESENTQTVTQTFIGVPMRKLCELQTKGWEINGVSIQRTNSDGVIERGAVTNGGMVLWWNSVPSAPVQEPVAWRAKDANGRWMYGDIPAPELPTNQPDPLYTTQPQREWVGLTDEERDVFSMDSDGWHDATISERVCSVEEKLKEKNQ